jgi:hypothetical protein
MTLSILSVRGACLYPSHNYDLDTAIEMLTATTHAIISLTSILYQVLRQP